MQYLDDKYPQYPLLPHDVPKRALNFQVAHIVLQDNFIEKKVGPHEKLPWAQSVIRKGFTGDTSLNTIKIYSALEKLLKDHAGRYATGDEIFLCKITWRILIGVAVENVIRQPIPKVSSTVFLKIWR
nr:glutathione S-transferase zeta class isoform X1 [Arachis hypogaea]